MELFCIFPQEIKYLAVDLQDGTLDLSLYKRQPSLSILPTSFKTQATAYYRAQREHLLTPYINPRKRTVKTGFGCSDQSHKPIMMSCARNTGTSMFSAGVTGEVKPIALATLGRMAWLVVFAQALAVEKKDIVLP